MDLATGLPPPQPRYAKVVKAFETRRSPTAVPGLPHAKWAEGETCRIVAQDSTPPPPPGGHRHLMLEYRTPHGCHPAILCVIVPVRARVVPGDH